MRRVGVLMHLAADDPESLVRVAAFAQGLQELGWTVGRNVQIDTRWAAGDAERFRRYAGAGRHPRLNHPEPGSVATGEQHRAEGSPTRSVRASLRAYRGQAATRLVFLLTNTALA